MVLSSSLRNCKEPAMATTHHQENSNVATKERHDYEDGYDTGYFTPYYPKEREAIVLTNIEKVSPSFVKGYKDGCRRASLEDWVSQAEPDELDDWQY